MSNPEASIVKDIRRGRRQWLTYSDGTQWTRKLDIHTGEPFGERQPVEALPENEPEPLQLHVVLDGQADGEPKHWSLYAARDNAGGTSSGQVWQVRGDAEFMQYEHASDVNSFESQSFYWHQTVNSDLSDSEFDVVDRIARSEPPPRAKSRKEVKENCQGWTIRVLRRLAAEGIVRESAIADLQKVMDPIR